MVQSSVFVDKEYSQIYQTYALLSLSFRLRGYRNESPRPFDADTFIVSLKVAKMHQWEVFYKHHLDMQVNQDG